MIGWLAFTDFQKTAKRIPIRKNSWDKYHELWRIGFYEKIERFSSNCKLLNMEFSTCMITMNSIIVEEIWNNIYEKYEQSSAVSVEKERSTHQTIEVFPAYELWIFPSVLLIPKKVIHL